MSTEYLARLEQAVEPYRAAGYQIVSQTGWSITLVRRGEEFSTASFIILLIVFWPAAILYSASHRNRRDRSVCVRMASDGVVEESGDTLDFDERKQRTTIRAWRQVFIICGLLILIVITAVVMISLLRPLLRTTVPSRSALPSPTPPMVVRPTPSPRTTRRR